ncbi:MAG: deoxyribodipyrimidine photo-lyase [Pseudomonadota bacterium]|nr:deoxyribodipyrimidine photo-lyase [Pseudomonadota bacterium]
MKQSIVLFRQDLRLLDNPALAAASDGKILPVFIHDQESLGDWPIGENSQLWQDAALHALNEQLEQHLHIASGHSDEILLALCKQHNITHVYWNRCYEPSRIKHDTLLKKTLSDAGLSVESFNASLLWEPWTILNQHGESYKVFTPFYRKGCLASTEPRDIVAVETPLNFIKTQDSELITRQEIKDWDVSERGAIQQFETFVAHGLNGYKTLRDFPGKPNTSRLSPYIHWGMISPHTMWHHVKSLVGIVADKDIDHFLSELGWREFSYYQLYHHPTLPHENWQKKFDHFKWENNPEHLLAWQQGKTGIPIVDAAMRELLHTGYMHNRMRMVTASFLIKNLLIDWREGEKWFWHHLYDADLASNSASWQWVAGSGFDAAPYFRIFNPILQGKKFDPEGEYVVRHIPELANLPIKYLFTPWEAPDDILEQAGIVLGQNYPHPIVDLQTSRNEALARFKSLGEAQ